MIAPAAHDVESLHVSFEGHEVIVGSDAPEVLAGLRRMFAPMLTPVAARTVGEITVSTKTDGYDVTADAAVDVAARSLDDLLRSVRFSVIHLLMQARPDLLWLHAGAAAVAGRAILLPGARGRGKSTLVSSLCARGWTCLSDDVVPVDPRTSEVLPFPMTPARRVFPGHEMPAEWLAAAKKVEAPLSPGAIARDPAPVHALVFPEFAGGAAARLARCSSAEGVIALLPQCWNFTSHREHAVRYLCELAQRRPTYRLSFSDAEAAADVLSRPGLLV